MSESTDRAQALREAIRSRVLCLDGAMGTAIQAANLSDEDYGGPDLAGCNENLVLTRPEVIESIHGAYIEAGADIIETNTFGSTPLVMDEYDLSARANEITLIATQIARRAADKLSTPERPRWVAGSIGPTTKAISVTGGVTFDELIDNFGQQSRALIEGGADYLLVETCQDTRNIKASLIAIDRLASDLGRKIDVAVSGTIEPMGTMLAGQSVEALVASMSHLDLLYIGLNCATGPEFMTDHIRSMAQLARWPVACVPNAGLPDEDGNYLESPDMMASVLQRFFDGGWLNVIGGCCGTTASHIQRFARLAKDVEPRKIEPKQRSFLSGIDYVEITDDMRPVLVGERTNVIGSRMFKRLIVEEKWEEATEIGRKQVKNGAQIIDVCLANPDREEMEDMDKFLSIVGKLVRVPLMIDSTDEDVVELALQHSQGKAIINSVNLEDGEERFEKICPLANRYGAALVVGTIDEDPVQAMAVTRQRKLEVAERCHELLTTKYGIPEEDVYWDPLVFPCGTGDENFLGSAIETIEGVRMIKERFPMTKTVLGVSNISFGLPPAGREVLNSVFLYECVQAGLDLAIVNSQKLERYANIPDEDKALCMDILRTGNEEAVAAFAAHFRERRTTAKVATESLPLDERLARYVVDGTKEGLIADLEEKLNDTAPLDIINGPMMTGMDEVGRLFNANELIVAEVLQSAEVMKTAVAFLEPKMDANDSAGRGKVMLATVKGDVHDIGKNLVEIILSNNGFKVVNLGIKVAPDQLLKAAREHEPDIIGLSGLLVKSAQEMVTTAGDLASGGTDVPIMVGGAALSRNFVDKRIAPKYANTVAYAQDAMDGLELAKTIVDPDKKKALDGRLADRRETLAAEGPKKKTVVEAPAIRSTQVPIIEAPPAAPDFEPHVIRNTPLPHIWSFINPLMLYGRHLGLKGKMLRKLDTPEQHELKDMEGGEKALEVWEAVKAVKDKYAARLAPQAMFQFFRAESENNTLHVLSPEGKRLKSIDLPRQPRADGLCLADYANPVGGPDDNICVTLTTCGVQVRELAEELKQAGDYLHSHIVQALALETAEGYIELLHGKIRSMWGYPDPPEMTMLERFQARYHGKRYSFGYPACPDLEGQVHLFDLLDASKIGVSLTDGFMMEPEASTSSIVFHHPEAKYFALKPDHGSKEKGE